MLTPSLTSSAMMRLLLAAMLWPLGVAAQGLDGLAAEAKADLAKAVEALATVRQTIEDERLPQARRASDLERQLIDQRAEFARAQRLQENQLVELNALKAQARQRSEEVKYVESLLTEYTRAFRSRLHFIEEPRFQALFEAAEQADGAADLEPAERFGQRAVVLSAALQRVESTLGGEVFDGKALDKQGRLREGKVGLLGPVAMFAATGAEAAGVLQQELNKPDPTIVEVDSGLAAGSRALVQSGTGQLALDATLGNAFKLAALEDTIFEKIEKGGWAMAPLIALAVASILTALVKWLQLARVRLASERDLQQVLRHLEDRDADQAMAVARTIPGPAGELLTVAVAHAEEKKEYLEEILYERILGTRLRLERGLQFLALSATTGPLLGLLGTVMGMIATFKLISSFGSGDPRLLAAGISEALICTATGMGVAIPSLLFHAFLSRRAKGILGSMEQTAVGFINGLPESYAALAR